MEVLQEMGVLLSMSKQNICIEFKICMFQRVQHSQNILLREGRHVLLFSMRFMFKKKKKKSIMKHSLC